MVFTHDFTDDTGGFFVWLVRRNAELAHSVKDSSVNRFQAVPCIRKSSCNDYAHSVIDIGVLHFIVDLMLDQLYII